jgi:hypothetical protein
MRTIGHFLLLVLVCFFFGVACNNFDRPDTRIKSDSEKPAEPPLYRLAWLSINPQLQKTDAFVLLLFQIEYTAINKESHTTKNEFTSIAITFDTPEGKIKPLLKATTVDQESSIEISPDRNPQQPCEFIFPTGRLQVYLRQVDATSDDWQLVFVSTPLFSGKVDLQYVFGQLALVTLHRSAGKAEFQNFAVQSEAFASAMTPFDWNSNLTSLQKTESKSFVPNGK